MELPQFNLLQTRRSFLGNTSRSMGAIALASLLNPTLLRATTNNQQLTTNNPDHYSGIIHPLHFPAKIKRVIHLYMAGGPSHLETFDHKPKLKELSGKPMPESVTKGQPIAQLQGMPLKIFEPQFEFQKFGASGQEVNSIFPHIGSIADKICIIRSMQGEAINHDPAHTFMNTGTTISGRPSMGSWLWYGIGSEADDLPGFVVLTSTGKAGQQQPISTRQWHSGFLPSKFQGVHFRSTGDAVLYMNNPKGISRDQQRETIDAIERLNRIEDNLVDDPEIATRIAQYEMAFKMQTSVPGLMDLSTNPKTSSTCTAPKAPMAPSPPTVYWRVASPSAASDSSRRITATGTTTTT